jgi:hypothetical protein
MYFWTSIPHSIYVFEPEFFAKCSPEYDNSDWRRTASSEGFEYVTLKYVNVISLKI